MTEDMHTSELSARLGAMEQRWKQTRFWRAAGNTLILLLAGLAIGALIDYFIPLTLGRRFVLTTMIYGSVALYAWFGWWRPHRRPMPPEKIAWVLEDLVPDFEEKLISAVELSGKHDEKISVDMINRILKDAEVDLSRVNPVAVFPLNWKSFVAPIIAAVVFLVALCTPALQFGRLVTRVAFPSDRQATVGAFRLIVREPQPGTRAEEDTIDFVVVCTDAQIGDVELYMEDDKVSRYGMDHDEARKRFTFSHADTRRSFRFWARSGRVLSTKYDITVLQRPRIGEFSIVYAFPEYTDIPASSNTLASGSLRGYPGTRARVHMTFNKPLEKADLTWLGEERALTLNEDGRSAGLDVSIEESGMYSLALLDRDGLGNLHDIEYPVVALEDKSPTVKLERPSGDVHLGLNDVLPVAWDAEDDFGVATQELVYTVHGRTPETITLDAAAGTFDWDLSGYTLQTGDEVSYRVRVYDARGARAESQARYLSLLKDSDLSAAAEYGRLADAILGDCRAIERRLDSVRAIGRQLKAGDNGGGAASEDAPHNRTMMKRHAQWISHRLSGGERRSRELEGRGFFPRSRLCADLMARYFRQERLFSAAALSVSGAPDAIASLADMSGLSAGMTTALKKKANEHVPAIQMRRMVRTGRSLKGAPSVPALERLVARARSIAKKHAPNMAGIFAEPAGWTNGLVKLQAELDKKANQYRELDRLAEEIRKRLKSRDEQMEELARQLALFNREQDWQSVEALKSALEESARETEHMQEQEDLELAADVLDKALEDRDASRVEAVTDRLPDLDREHELAVLRDEVRAARAETEEILSDLRAELGDAEPLSAEDREALEELDGTLDHLKETPVAGEALGDDRDTRKVYDELNASQRHLDELTRALEQSDPRRAEEQMRNLETRMDYAEARAEELAREAEQQADVSRNVLDNLAESLSEQLAEIQDMLAPSTPSTQSPPATPAQEQPEEMADRLDAASEQVAAMADELQREASREIRNPEGDIAQARDKMAMAEALQALNEEQLTPAANALDQAMDSPDPMSRIQDELAAAMQELADSKDLMARYEQAEEREIPLAERREVQAELQDIAEQTLPAEMLETLEQLERLRTSSEEAEMLAEQAEDLTSRSNKERAEELSDSVEELRQDLGHALMMEGREAFMDEAEQEIAEARQQAEDLLTDARNLRAQLREGADIAPEERMALEEQAEALQAKAEEVGEELAQAGAVMELLDPATDPGLDEFEDETLPQLTHAESRLEQARKTEEAQLARQGQPNAPKPNPEQIARIQDESADALEKAIDGMKEASATLDEFAEEMETMQTPAPRLAQRLQTPRGAEEAQEALAALDGIDNMMAEAQAAEVVARRQESELMPQLREAAELLERAPEEGMDERTRQKFDELAQKALQEDNPWEVARAMEQAANLLPGHEEQLRNELREQAREMKKAAQPHRSHGPGELERRIDDRIEDMEKAADRMEDDLAKIDSPLAESARETMERFEANLEAGDLEGAENNLEAARADLAELARGEDEPRPAPTELMQPVSPPPAEPMDVEALAQQNPALREAADPEQDWHTRKGLMETAAAAMRQPQTPEAQPVAQLAAEGNPKAAAEEAPMTAVDDFAKAAELKEALEPPAPVTDFAEPEEADDLKTRMNKDPAAFMEAAAEKVDEAQEAAETVAQQVQSGQVPRQEDMQELERALNDAEAMRAQMGAPKHPAQQAFEEGVEPPLQEARTPNLLEAEEGLDEVRNALAGYEDELEEAAEDLAAFEEMRDLAGQLEDAAAEAGQNPQAAKQLAQEMGERLEATESPAAAGAAEALQDLAQELEKPEDAQAIAAAAEEMAEQVETMNPLAADPANAETPAEFQQPREMLSDAEERALAQQAAEDRAGFLEDAAEELQEARQAAQAMEEALRQEQMPSEAQQAAVEEAVNKVEAMRDQLGERDFDAHRALEDMVLAELKAKGDVKDAAEGAKTLQDELARYQGELKSEAERQKAFDGVKELAEQLEASAGAEATDPEKAGQAARDLGDKLEGRKGLASQEAAEAVADLAEALQEEEGPQPAQVAEALAEVAEKVEALNPAREAQVAPNEEAFDAAARAAALENKDALEDALAGDYEAASESMEELAEQLPEGPKKEQAEQAAREFTAAREAQMEELPEDLAEAIEGAEPLEEELPAAAAKALEEATDAARAGDLPEASERLQDSIAQAKPEQKEALEKLDEEIKEAAGEAEERIASLSDEARDALEKVEGLAAETGDPVAQAALQEAAAEVKEQEFGRAAEKVAEAAMALPGEKIAKASDLAKELQAREQEQYGRMSEPAREGMKALQTPNEQIAEAARAADYEAAAELAKKAGEREAAEAFEDALEEQENALPDMVREGLENLARARKRADSEAEGVLEAAEKAARKGELAKAAELAQRAADMKPEEAALADALEKADAFRKDSVDPLQAAMEDAMRNRFGQAAAKAAQSELGQQPAEELAKAEEAMQEGIRETFEDAFAAKNRNQAQQLEQAARAAQNDDLNQAMQSASRAGREGKEARQGFERAQQAGEQAKKALEEALKNAPRNSPPTQQAAELLAGQKQDAADQAKSAADQMRQAQQDQQHLRQAAQALSHNRPDQAAKSAAKASDRQPLAQQLSQLPKDAPKNDMQRAQKAVQQAARDAAREYQQANKAQRDAQREEAMWNQAQQDLAQNRFDEAAEVAKQAAQGSFEAMKAADAFAQAAQMQQALAQQQSRPAPSPAGQPMPGQPPQPGQLGQSGQQQMASRQSDSPAQPGQPPQAGQPQTASQQSGQPPQPGQPAQTGQPQMAGQQPGQPDQPGQQPQPGQPPQPGQSAQAGQSQTANQPGQQSSPGQPPQPGQAPQPGQPQMAGQQPGQQPGQPSAQPGQPSQQAAQPGQPSQSGQPAQSGQPQMAGQQPGQPAQPGQQPGQNRPGMNQAGEGPVQEVAGRLGTQGVDLPLEPGEEHQADEARSLLPAQEVSKAVIDLQTAKAKLAASRDQARASEDLHDAARALDQASAAVTQSALDQVYNNVMPPMNDQGARQDSPSGFSAGGPQGNRAPQNAAAAVPFLQKGKLGDEWDGVRDRLRSGDRSRRKMQYNEYYRKANRQYLEKLMKESKR